MPQVESARHGERSHVTQRRSHGQPREDPSEDPRQPNKFLKILKRQWNSRPHRRERRSGKTGEGRAVTSLYTEGPGVRIAGH